MTGAAVIVLTTLAGGQNLSSIHRLMRNLAGTDPIPKSKSLYPLHI